MAEPISRETLRSQHAFVSDTAGRERNQRDGM